MVPFLTCWRALRIATHTAPRTCTAQSWAGLEHAVRNGTDGEVACIGAGMHLDAQSQCGCIRLAAGRFGTRRQSRLRNLRRIHHCCSHLAAAQSCGGPLAGLKGMQPRVVLLRVACLLVASLFGTGEACAGQLGLLSNLLCSPSQVASSTKLDAAVKAWMVSGSNGSLRVIV